MAGGGTARDLARAATLPALRNLRIAAVALAGGALCTFLQVPAGWLTGGMAASAAAVAGLRWQGPSPRMVDAAMLLCGLVLGGAATPEAIEAATRYPASLAVLAVAVVAIVLATGGYLAIVARWARLDALLAAAPGALSAVMAVGIACNRDLSRIVFVQLFRLFALVALLPSIVILSGVAPSDLRPAAADIVSPAGLLALGVAGVATASLFQRLGLMSPVILGAAVSSAILHGTGLVRGTLPGEIAIFSFVLLSAAMGGRFGVVTLSGIAAMLPAALVGFAISMAVAMGFAWPASALADVPYATALIAFAPGGLETMAVLAFMLGLDPLYVAAHHLLRFFAVGFGLPLVARRVAHRDGHEVSP